MNKPSRINSLTLLVPIPLIACGGNENNNPDSTSEFNPDLSDDINTGEPGGDITPIAGLWDGSTNDGGDVIYWNFAADGLLTRYDYQQDSALDASGENCYLVGEPITVTPEGDNDYSIDDVAVTAVVSGDTLDITFLDADKNDLDEDGDTQESPGFSWVKLNSPVLEDLNACTLASEDEETQNSSAGSDSEEPLQPSFFNLTIDGQVMTGGGITFLQQAGSSLHIRGLTGQTQSHYQVDLIANETADGTYQLGTNGTEGSVSEIIGQDAVDASYSANGGESDLLTFVWDRESERITGTFGFTAMGNDAQMTLNGEFDLDVSESTDWTCNFDDDIIRHCWFVE